MNGLEGMILEYYTTTDNSRRIQLKTQIIDKVSTKEHIIVLQNLLQSTKNPHVQTYCMSLLSQGVLDTPQLFIGHSETIQLLSLQLYKNSPQTKRSASNLFASSVIGCWQFEHNTENLVKTLHALEGGNYEVFVDMSNTLIETFRSYQTKPNFPKKITADFRNSILMVIASLAGKNLARPGNGAISILENTMFVCNITRTDETDEAFTFCPTRDFLDFYMSILDTLIARVPDSLNLLDQMVCIRPSCFSETAAIENSRDWFITKMVKVVEFCATSGRPELIGISTKLLSHLHATHPVFNYISQEFIDAISVFTLFTATTGDSASIYDILRFWGMYSLYPSFLPSNIDFIIALFCRLVEDEYEEINESAFLHFGVLVRIGLEPMLEFFQSFIGFVVAGPVPIPQTHITILQRVYKTIADSRSDIEKYYVILSNIIILASCFIAGRDPTDSMNVGFYSVFGRKICDMCTSYIVSINSTSFDRVGDSAQAQLQMAILMFYKHYITSYLWDESKNYREDGMVIIKSDSINNALRFYMTLIEMIFTLIPMWGRNHKVLMEITRVLAKVVSVSEYANKAVRVSPLKYLFEVDCFGVIQNVVLPINEIIEFRTEFYMCLGLLLYNIPFIYHLNFLKQFLQPHPFQLIDIRAIVKSSHSCVENIPPIFEHVCANYEVYLRPMNETVSGDYWFFVLKLAKQITISRDFKYNYAPECPTACKLFRYISQLVIVFSNKASAESTTLLSAPKGEAFDNFVRNATLAIRTTIFLLQNNHINFAAFKLYNDDTMISLVNSSTSLATMLEPYSFSYPKTFETLLKFCEEISKQVVPLQLEAKKVEFIIRFACRALKEKKVLYIVSGSSAIESILFEAYKHRSSCGYCVALLSALQGLISDIIMNVFDNLFNEFEAWTLERLVFAIIVIYPEIYQKTQFRIASFIQNPSKRQKFMSYFQMIDLGGTIDLDDRKISSFDEKLKEFVSAIKPLYHNNTYE